MGPALRAGMVRTNSAEHRPFSASYKLDILDEYDRLTEPGFKGALVWRAGR